MKNRTITPLVCNSCLKQSRLGFADRFRVYSPNGPQPVTIATGRVCILCEDCAKKKGL